MSHPHPWRLLRALPHITLLWQRMPGRMGATNGRDEIVLHPDQLQVERRCTLAHELAHIELGHVDGCSSSEEQHAARLAARWLVPIEALGDVVVWTRCRAEAADALWVDEPTLVARLAGLHPAEKHYLQQRLAAADHSV